MPAGAASAAQAAAVAAAEAIAATAAVEVATEAAATAQAAVRAASIAAAKATDRAKDVAARAAAAAAATADQEGALQDTLLADARAASSDASAVAGAQVAAVRAAATAAAKAATTVANAVATVAAAAASAAIEAAALIEDQLTSDIAETATAVRATAADTDPSLAPGRPLLREPTHGWQIHPGNHPLGPSLDGAEPEATEAQSAASGRMLPHRALLGAQAAANLGTWDLDLRTDRLSWDEPMAELHGLSLDSFDSTVEAAFASTPAMDRDAAYTALSACARNGGRFDIRYRTVWPDDTEHELLSRGRALSDETGQGVRLLGACVDVTSLLTIVRELEVALGRDATAAERLSCLAAGALDLASARSVDEVLRVIVDHGTHVLGADAGATCVRDTTGALFNLTLSDGLGERARRDYGQLPLDSPLPFAVTARTGRMILLPDQAAGLRLTPLMEPVVAATGRRAWAVLPLRTAGRLLGSVALGWVAERRFDALELEFLQAFAAQAALALDRAQSQQAELDRSRADRHLSEMLQRSLLTRPPAFDELQVAVRYTPAADGAQIGGDWYDAFVAPDGSVSLVIGDCAGHDHSAATAMAGLRNLLRGAAYSAHAPAAVLTLLERMMVGLEVDTLATGVLAQVDAATPGDPHGARRMRWSNAGHLPPLLRTPGGLSLLLRTPPDLLLGLGPETLRREHVTELSSGSTVLLYTDGLVERRGEDLDIGLERLRDAVAELGALPLEQLCDALLDRMLTGDSPEDDVALLAARVGPRQTSGLG